VDGTVGRIHHAETIGFVTKITRQQAWDPASSRECRKSATATAEGDHDALGVRKSRVETEC
jgi:hypothetical protein